MGIFEWIVLAFFVAMTVLVIWTVHRQNHMFPKGTRVGDPDERKPDHYRWVTWWHRGGSGGL